MKLPLLLRRVAHWLRIKEWRRPAGLPKAAWVTLTLGVLTTLIITFAAVRVERQQMYASLSRAAEDRASAIERQLRHSAAVLEVVRSFWLHSGSTSEEEFLGFYESLASSGTLEQRIRFVEWLPAISPELRAGYEKSLGARLGHPSFIREYGPRRSLRPAAGRPLYFPVTYIAPLAGNAGSLGFDSGCLPQTAPAIQRAIRDGRTTATSRLHLLQDAADRSSFVLYTPVYPPNQHGRSRRPAGLLAVGITVDHVVEAAIGYMHPAGLHVSVREVGSGGAESTLYLRRSPLSNQPPDFDGPWTYRRSVPMADKEWSIVIAPIAEVGNAGFSWRNWAILLLGLLLSGLITYAVSGFVRRQARLRQVIVRRTRKMREASLAAKEASRAKSQFLANMSHEVRTPLNGIMGMATLLEEETAGTRLHDYAATIMNSSRHLLDVVNEILDFSKADARKLKLNVYPFALREELDVLARVARRQAEEKGLRFRFHVGDSVPAWVSADPYRYRQIVLNLINNAIKFTDKGEVAVGFQAENPGGASLVLRCDVTDTGIGMAESELGRIFHAFEQADSSDRRRHEGTGLGLPLARELAELMGGSLHCVSTLGAGSRFWFTARVEHAEPMQQPSLHQTETPATLQQLQVLVAEDNAVNQKVIRNFIERLGCKITVTPNGAEAIKACRAAKYDAILLDLQMPVLDGLSAAAAIRALGGWCAEVPILAISASVEADYRQACTDAGMDGFVEKPIQLAQLARALAAACERPPERSPS
jgi:signal transduction histidine kinase/CheY-like chemotaxis protein